MNRFINWFRSRDELLRQLRLLNTQNLLDKLTIKKLKKDLSKIKKELRI